MNKFQELVNNHILLSSPFLWPNELKFFLTQHTKLIENYFYKEKEFDLAAQEDVLLRSNRPQNPFQSHFTKIQSDFRNIIIHQKIISFHCSRLTKQEQKSIILGGLEPLSKALIDKKIDEIRKQRIVQNSILEIIKNNNNSSDNNRTGMLWFFHGQETLKDPGAIYRLLSTWGGESLYCGYEGTNIHSYLQSIGEPCVVITLLPPHDLNRFKEIEYRMLEIWNDRNGDHFNHGQDTYVTRKIQVRQMINYSNPLFEELTNASQWGKKLMKK